MTNKTLIRLAMPAMAIALGLMAAATAATSQAHAGTSVTPLPRPIIAPVPKFSNKERLKRKARREARKLVSKARKVANGSRRLATSAYCKINPRDVACFKIEANRYRPN